MDVIQKRHSGRIDHNHLQAINLRTLRGITLIELMTVMAIIAITLGFGIPAVSAILQTNRMATAINSLSAGFALARSEAVTRNQEIVICKSHDGVLCTNKGGWEQGWIIFADTNHNEHRDEDEPRFHVQDALPPGIKVSFSAFESDHYVHYWPTGFTLMNGTFTFCQENQAELTKALVLSRIGRLRKSKTHPDGSPLKCS